MSAKATHLLAKAFLDLHITFQYKLNRIKFLSPDFIHYICSVRKTLTKIKSVSKTCSTPQDYENYPRCLMVNYTAYNGTSDQDEELLDLRCVNDTYDRELTSFGGVNYRYNSVFRTYMCLQRSHGAGVSRCFKTWVPCPLTL